MDLAERIAKESYATRLQVGCIIVKNDNPISISWNGTPPGWDNSCELNNTTRPEVLHAEENALGKLAKTTGGADGAIIFVTHQPCLNCARLIYKSGISEVYYRHKYRLTDGLDFLAKTDIYVEQMPCQTNFGDII